MDYVTATKTTKNMFNSKSLLHSKPLLSKCFIPKTQLIPLFFDRFQLASSSFARVIVPRRWLCFSNLLNRNRFDPVTICHKLQTAAIIRSDKVNVKVNKRIVTQFPSILFFLGNFVTSILVLAFHWLWKDSAKSKDEDILAVANYVY